ncbi:predicted protein [Botrytis cinerea T4]|uniref:Uncharacterized protein n=1 Tax=Botryotinia fuckeliana (strain T4) TaxID=999810 RepID=G2YWJ4_BOTF4|nr:predicted protein [Botrytis cinerea T4]
MAPREEQNRDVELMHEWFRCALAFDALKINVLERKDSEAKMPTIAPVTTFIVV